MSGRRTARASIVLASVAALLAGGGATTACGGCPGVDAPQPTAQQQVLLDPRSEAFRAPAPDTFVVRFETSKGDFVVQVNRAWAPLGAQRFYGLVRNGYYDGVRFFRVIPGFMAQFGVHGVPAVNDAWSNESIADDPVLVSNTRGMVTYAKAGPETRTTQVFVNYRDNSALDADGFAPFGRVIEGMDVVDRLYGEYGETAPGGAGPDYACLVSGGNAYLARSFERMDSVVTATIVREANATAVADSLGGR
jgi:peptidyl-prolyl cis-trans isomerase A (cyclophilin A)